MRNADANRSTVGRRELLLAAATAAFAADSTRAQLRSPMSEQVPIDPPKAEFVYEAIVEIAPGLDLGAGPLGPRAMVPITGGTFEGPDIRGVVLPGGADRQLVRADGYRQLDALYELETDDGAIITVRNQVLIAGQPGMRPLSSLQITAPEGKYGWLNRSVHVGTLNGMGPERRPS